MTSNTCCECGIADSDVRAYEMRKTLPGWPGRVSPFTDRSGRAVVWYLHPACQRERYREEYAAFSEMDKPINDCRWFVRDGKTEYGHYVRDGVKCPLQLWQAHSESTGLPPEFVTWLQQAGFWPDWWARR